MFNNKRTIFHLTQPGNRLLISLIFAIIIHLITYLPTGKFYAEIRFLLTYNGAIFTYLALLSLRMIKATPEDTLHIAQAAEANSLITLCAVNLLSIISLFIIGLLLDNSQKWSPFLANLHLGLSLIAIFLSWILVHTFFAIHYARLYYEKIPGEQQQLTYQKGLEFPQEGLVDYWDFMYYSFTIGMCYQTSDISIISPIMRRFTLIHSIISFVFVAVILGLVVNLVSNLI